jgi:hypothetical protein
MIKKGVIRINEATTISQRKNEIGTDPIKKE